MANSDEVQIIANCMKNKNFIPEEIKKINSEMLAIIQLEIFHVSYIRI
jgi:hypothetical protein